MRLKCRKMKSRFAPQCAPLPTVSSFLRGKTSLPNHRPKAVTWDYLVFSFLCPPVVLWIVFLLNDSKMCLPLQPIVSALVPPLTGLPVDDSSVFPNGLSTTYSPPGHGPHLLKPQSDHSMSQIETAQAPHVSNQGICLIWLPLPPCLAGAGTARVHHHGSGHQALRKGRDVLHEVVGGSPFSARNKLISALPGGRGRTYW